jgi:Ca2+-binding EF-hand superfamily protein
VFNNNFFSLLSNSGQLNRDDFELLLMAMGHNLSQREIEGCLQDMGVGNNGAVTFDLFFDWWSDSMGMDAMRKKNRK